MNKLVNNYKLKKCYQNNNMKKLKINNNKFISIIKFNHNKKLPLKNNIENFLNKNLMIYNNKILNQQMYYIFYQ